MFPLNVVAATLAEKINLTTQTLTNADNPPGGANVISGIRLNANGNAERISQWDTAPQYSPINQPDDWNDIKKNMQNYEAQATSSDTVGFGNALNTWIGCETSPQWAAERAVPSPGTTTAIIAVTIRHKTTLQVRANAVYTCVATEI